MTEGLPWERAPNLKVITSAFIEWNPVDFDLCTLSDVNGNLHMLVIIETDTGYLIQLYEIMLSGQALMTSIYVINWIYFATVGEIGSRAAISKTLVSMTIGPTFKFSSKTLYLEEAKLSS